MKERCVVLKRESLSKQVYHLLKEMIILQKTPGFQMGEKINEAAIAKLFNCSVTPVREAINMLRQAGLIVGDSYQSSSIVSFSRKDAEDLFDIRKCLEVWAFQKAFSLLNEEDYSALALAQKHYQQAYEIFDETAIIRCNWEFHNIILCKADNKFLREEINGLVDRIAMVRAPVPQYKKSMGSQENLLLPVREHELILTLIKEGNFKGAESALINHLDRVKVEALELLDF